METWGFTMGKGIFENIANNNSRKKPYSNSPFYETFYEFILFFILIAFVFSYKNVNASQDNFTQFITTAFVSPSFPAFIGQTTVRLNGNISLDTTYDNVEYYFEYGRTANYTDKTDKLVRPGDNVSKTDVVADVLDLQCATNYHFRLVIELTAEDVVTVVPSEDFVFTTAECSAIEIFVVDVISKTKESVILSGSFNANGLQATFYFKYGDTLELQNSTTLVTQTGVSILETLGELQCGTKYYYQLYVSDGFTIVQTPTLSFETILCSAAPALIDLVPTDISENTVTLQVEVSANGAESSVFFEYGDSRALSLMTNVVRVNEGAIKRTITFPIDNLSCGTRYFYQAAVTNDFGVAEGRLKNFDTTACLNQEPISDGVPRRIFGGKNHSVAIGKSGELVIWGSNQFGQLGQGVGAIDVIDVLRKEDETDSRVLYGFKSASAGGEHTLLLHNDGRIFSVGNNNIGQAGLSGVSSIVTTPTELYDEDEIQIVDAVSVAAGDKHSVAALSDGSVLIWGDNTFGQLGNDIEVSSHLPAYISGLDNVLEVVAGDDFSVARMQDNTLLAWGDNTNGQLGNGQVDNGSVQINFEPKAVSGVSNIILIGAGSNHVLALRSDGQVFAWGNNDSGQLGVGDVDSRALPSEIDSALLEGVVQIAAGAAHSLALLSDGTVIGWGDNSFYQLGIENDSPLAQVLEPVVITDATGIPLTDIVSISTGDYFSSVLTRDGRIISWGDNTKGQLSGDLSVQGSRVALVNGSNALVNMNQPRIVTNSNNLIISEGESVYLSIWLTEDPKQSLTVRSRLSENSGLIIEDGAALGFFSNDWFKKRTISIRVDKAGMSEAVLFVEAAGVTSLKVNLDITTPNGTPVKKTVGAIHFISLLLIILFLLYSRIKIIIVKG